MPNKYEIEAEYGTVAAILCRCAKRLRKLQKKTAESDEWEFFGVWIVNPIASVVIGSILYVITYVTLVLCPRVLIESLEWKKRRFLRPRAFLLMSTALLTLWAGQLFSLQPVFSEQLQSKGIRDAVTALAFAGFLLMTAYANAVAVSAAQAAIGGDESFETCAGVAAYTMGMGYSHLNVGAAFYWWYYVIDGPFSNAINDLLCYGDPWSFAMITLSVAILLVVSMLRPFWVVAGGEGFGMFFLAGTIFIVLNGMFGLAVRLMCSFVIGIDASM